MAQNVPERVFAVFCSVETLLSKVCISEVIVCETSVKQFCY